MSSNDTFRASEGIFIFCLGFPFLFPPETFCDLFQDSTDADGAVDGDVDGDDDVDGTTALAG